MAKISNSHSLKPEASTSKENHEKRFLDPKNDVSFKKVFGEEASKPLLVSFINSLLELEGADRVNVIKLLNPQQLPIVEDRKFTIIDILCEDQRGYRYVVEMQLGQHAGFEKRAQLYSSRAYSGQHEAATPYTALNPVIFLGILNYVAFAKEADFKTEHLMLTKTTYKHYLKDIRYFFVELPKFNKQLSELETIEDKWLYFLRHAPEALEIPESLAEEQPIAQAYGILERYKWNEAQLYAYQHARVNDEVLVAQKEAGFQEGLEKGKAEGIQEGIEKGRLAERTAMIRQLQSLGIDMETIQKAMNCSKADLNAIVAENGL